MSEKNLAGEIFVEDALLREKYITANELKKAKEFSLANNISIIEYLLIKGLINNNILGQIIAEWFKLPYFNLSSKPATTEQVLKIPEEIAKKYRVVFIKGDDKDVVITTDDPKGLIAHAQTLKQFFGKKNIQLNYSLAEDIDSAFKNYKRSLKARFIEIINSGQLFQLLILSFAQHPLAQSLNISLSLDNKLVFNKKSLHQ